MLHNVPLIIISHVFNFTENKENKLITRSFLEDNQGVQCMKHSKTKANLVQYILSNMKKKPPQTIRQASRHHLDTLSTAAEQNAFTTHR